jgi:hypothetical protein
VHFACGSRQQTVRRCVNIRFTSVQLRQVYRQFCRSKQRVGLLPWQMLVDASCTLSILSNQRLHGIEKYQ